MPDLLTNPWFYAAAIPAVIVVGLSKGGFGGVGSVFSVPLMSLMMSPVQAAAIILPILVLMDVVSLWSWRGQRDPVTLRYMLPGAMAGIAIGWATAALITAGAVRIIVGVVAVSFALRWFLGLRFGPARKREHSTAAGSFWGAVAGFTSFVAHAGGPPYQVYALPLGQPPALYVGTNVVFFAVVNFVKLLPYFMLGQFDTQNLAISAALMPIAPAATLAGAWLVRRVPQAIFYRIMYTLMLVVSSKLLYDGALEVFG